MEFVTFQTRYISPNFVRVGHQRPCVRHKRMLYSQKQKDYEERGKICELQRNYILLFIKKNSRMAGRHKTIDNNRKQMKKEQAMAELY